MQVIGGLDKLKLQPSSQCCAEHKQAPMVNLGALGGGASKSLSNTKHYEVGGLSFQLGPTADIFYIFSIQTQRAQ